MTHRPALDGVRALAVVAVVVSHVGTPLTDGGWVGVDVFFVLSGYLITSLLITEWNDRRAVSLRRFYWRRAVRLVPALLVMLALGGVILAALGDSPRSLAASAAGGVFYYQDFIYGITGSAGSFSHTWSLALEEQFYLVWPLVLIACLRRGRSALPWAAGGTTASWGLLAVFSHPGANGIPFTYFRPDTRANELLLGCVVALVLARWPRVARLASPAVGVVAGAGLVALVVVAGQVGRQHDLAVEVMAAGVLSAVLVASVQQQRGPLAWLLSLRPLTYLGKISYAMYLWFPVGLAIAWRLVDHRSQVAVVGLLITGAFAVASHYLVERPTARLRERHVPAVESSWPSKSRISPEHSLIAVTELS